MSQTLSPVSIRPSDALLVVDVQLDFCAGGALAVPDADAVVDPINRIAAQFPVVVLTQDWHTLGHASFASTYGKAPFETLELVYGTQVLWPDHCVMASAGANFHPGLRIPGAQMIVRKGFHPGVDSYSAFMEADRATHTGLAGYLIERGIARVFVVGLAMDFCVAWTALDALRAGFEVVVLEDACRAIDMDGSLEKSRTDMRQAGVILARSEALATEA